MGNGYTRQDNLTDRSLDIDLNNLEAAFDATSGHSHDGTEGESQKINLTTSVTGQLPTANIGVVNYDKLINGDVGEANTGVTATEYGAGRNRTTVLSFTDLALPDVADNAASAVGVLLYTLPDGAQLITSSFMNIGLTLDDAVQTDTPDVGLGTTIATGSVATLDGTAAFENIMTGQTFAGVDGTAEEHMVATTLANTSTDDKTIHLNAADTWANTTTQGLTATGIVVINWTVME